MVDGETEASPGFERAFKAYLAGDEKPTAKQGDRLGAIPGNAEACLAAPEEAQADQTEQGRRAAEDRFKKEAIRDKITAPGTVLASPFRKNQDL